MASARRVQALIHLGTPNKGYSHENEGMYGVGTVRPVSMYYRVFGIDGETHKVILKLKCDQNRLKFY